MADWNAANGPNPVEGECIIPTEDYVDFLIHIRCGDASTFNHILLDGGGERFFTEHLLEFFVPGEGGRFPIGRRQFETDEECTILEVDISRIDCDILDGFVHLPESEYILEGDGGGAFELEEDAIGVRDIRFMIPRVGEGLLNILDDIQCDLS